MSLAPVGEAVRGVARPGSPYVGLVPYDEGDAAFFFGRSAEAAIVAMNLRAARLTILYGPSGVGKSSLLMAGVVHDLREEAEAAADDSPFFICVFRSWRDDPAKGLSEVARAALQGLAGGEPLPPPAATLTDTLRAWTGRKGTLLVVLDQFEEYFQYHPDESDDERLTGFAAELARIVNDPGLPVNVLLSIREDAWAKLDRFEGHIPALFANYVRVDHLDLGAAREAIEGPIAAWNRSLSGDEQPFEFEPELVEAVLAATAGGSLTLTAGSESPLGEAAGNRVEAPFLQLVLDRLWRDTSAAGEHTLTLARLQALGGAARIVENHLLDALDLLLPPEQDTAAACFRFLVSRSKTKIAHPATDLAEWTQRPEAQVTAVLDKLCTGESGRILRAIAPAQDEASASYELYHDILGEPILAWRKQYEQGREQEAEAQRQRAVRRRLVRLVGVLLLTAIAFAGFAGWALHERGVAAKRTEVAGSQALAARALERFGTDPAAGLRLALGALAKSHTPQAELALRDALLGSRVRFVIPAGKPTAGSAAPIEAVFSPGGGLLLTTGVDGVARLWHTASGRQAAALEVPRHRIVDAAFDPRGRFVLTTGDDSTARLWNTSNGREVARLHVPGEHVLAATFGLHGPVVLTGAPHRPPELRDVRTPGRFVVLARQTEPPARAVFSPDGRLLLTFGAASAARVFDTRSGRRLATLRTHPVEASFSGDGRFVVTVEGRVRVWRVTTGRPVAVLDRAAHAALSAHGRRVLTVDRDGTATVWQTVGGSRVAVLPGYGNVPSGTYVSTFSPTGAFSTDGRLVATTNLDGTVRVWETASARQLVTIAAGYANRIAFSPDGRLLASVTWDGTVVVSQAVPSVTITTGFGPPTPDLCCQGFEPVLSPNGKLVVAATNDGAAVWRTDGKEAGRLPQAKNTIVSSAAFSADGMLVATSSLEEVAIEPPPALVTTVWRTRDFRRVAAVPGQAQTVDLSPDGRFVAADGIWRRISSQTRIPALKGTVAFDADGRRAVVARGRAGARVIDVPDGSLVATLQGGVRSLSEAVFSPDGDRLVGIDHGVARLWDPANGRLVAVLGRSGESSEAHFSPDGEFVLTSASARLSRWRASDGKFVEPRAAPGQAVFSPDGAFAAIPEDGGRLAIIDLATATRTDIQTGTAAKLTSATFGPGSRLLVAWDANGNVQVVACEICAPEAAQLALARDRLASISAFRPRAPQVSTVAVG